jgi:hypothetical protein
MVMAMMEATPVWGVGLLTLVFLAILALFGITWMFHHHHWKPVVGGFLFLLGVAALLMFGWAMPRHAAVNEAFAPRSVVQYPAGTLPPDAVEPAPIGEHFDASAPGRLDVRADAATARSPQPTESTTGTSHAEHPESKPSTDSKADTGSPTQSASRPAEDDRPSWADRPDGSRWRDKGVEKVAVVSELFATRAECSRAIVSRVNEIVTEYVADNVPEAAENGFEPDREYIWSRFVRDNKDKYWETVNKSFGNENHEMSKLHLLLSFDNKIGRDVAEQARQAVIGTRLMNAAEIAGCSLAVLGGVYLLLKRGASPRAPTPEQVA